MNDLRSPETARTFRSASGPIAAVVVGLLALFLLGDAVIRGGWVQTLLLAPWVLLGVWVTYEVSFASMVRIDDEGVVIHNMLRRTSFGWSRVRGIDVKWQLTFSLDNGKNVTCFGGPARSRSARSDVRGDRVTMPPAELRELTEIRDRWQAASGADAPIRRTWDVPALAALAVIAIWAVGALLVTAAN